MIENIFTFSAGDCELSVLPSEIAAPLLFIQRESR